MEIDLILLRQKTTRWYENQCGEGQRNKNTNNTNNNSESSECIMCNLHVFTCSSQRPFKIGKAFDVTCRHLFPWEAAYGLFGREAEVLVGERRHQISCRSETAHLPRRSTTTDILVNQVMVLLIPNY